MKLKNQITLIILSLAATTSLVFGQEQDTSQPQNARRSIVGTWVVTRHAANCSTGQRMSPDFPALMTFNEGGTLNAYAIPPDGSTPANASPEYGNWVKTGPQSYRFRDISFGYDGNGVFTGSGIITATVTLDNDGDRFDYKSTIEVYDANGKFLFSFCGQATGKRF